MIETARLRLRAWRDDDVERLARLNADERFRRFLGPPPDSHEQLARLRRHWREHGFGQYAVEERQSARFAGRTGLSYHELWPDDPELGWGITPELWGRGYAPEAAAAVLEHAFGALGLARVVSIIHPQNAASIRVAEKLGEQLHATVQSDGFGEVLVYARETSAS